jgi:hypothetical protein
VDVGARSSNGISCKQNWVYRQNICVKNSSELQKFKIIIDKEVKCKSKGPGNTARKHNIKNRPKGYNNEDLRLTHILPHKK